MTPTHRQGPRQQGSTRPQGHASQGQPCRIAGSEQQATQVLCAPDPRAPAPAPCRLPACSWRALGEVWAGQRPAGRRLHARRSARAQRGWPRRPAVHRRAGAGLRWAGLLGWVSLGHACACASLQRPASKPLCAPSSPSSPRPAAAAAAGDSHTCMLTELGAVWAWGTYRDASGVMGFGKHTRIQVWGATAGEGAGRLGRAGSRRCSMSWQEGQLDWEGRWQDTWAGRSGPQDCRRCSNGYGHQPKRRLLCCS